MRIPSSAPTAVAITAVLATAVTACGGAKDDMVRPNGCVITTDDTTVELHTEQAEHAATITAIGLQRDIGEQGIVVALATARQESDLFNIDYGDRDSLGLFQQRPSQGWGSPEEILDPRYATTTFYEKLEKIDGWESMRITEAAQAVQRSAFPEAYQKWEDHSQAIAETFIGSTDVGVNCVIDKTEPDAEPVANLTEALVNDWGEETVHSQADRSLTIPTSDTQNGWQYANWLVAHADNHNIARVVYGDVAWEAGSGEWEQLDEPEARDLVKAVFD